MVAFYMGVILSFSSDPSMVSNAKSGSIVEFVLPVVNRIVRTVGSQSISWGMLDTIIRKCAHMFNYCVLSILCCNAFYITLQKWKLSYSLIFTWLLASAFSVIDEFYQTFVPGRSGQLLDVGIDNIGILVGIGIAILVFRFAIKKMKYTMK